MSTTTDFYANAGGDGGECKGDNSWSNARNSATAGTVWKTNYASAIAHTTNAGNIDGLGGTYDCVRGFFPFDTSPIGAGKTVLSAVLNIKIQLTVGADNICLVDNSQNSATDLVAGDFNKLGTTLLASAVPASSFSAGNYYNWTLNATGIASINITGPTKIGVRAQRDIDNTTPTNESGIWAYFADRAGTSEDPYLTITYDVAPVGPAHLKTINGLAKANIKTINGRPMANIKTYNGVA